MEQYVRRNLGEEVFERLIEPFCRCELHNSLVSSHTLA